MLKRYTSVIFVVVGWLFRQMLQMALNLSELKAVDFS